MHPDPDVDALKDLTNTPCEPDRLCPKQKVCVGKCCLSVLHLDDVPMQHSGPRRRASKDILPDPSGRHTQECAANRLLCLSQQEHPGKSPQAL
eukprot:CAMPEP_0196751838 /NCGR_PEP_ID=MMETSP1091-20130531/85149_1 /TAXON_ID=302021 /ORGANISM="Rhodomonas sp., Strain CCMP768" /LENGTH=92 /DNA_ID=CAMNT_0042099687 /DNA_START=112 /DNA_END=387 /DNA_ORIENTATION=-